MILHRRVSLGPGAYSVIEKPRLQNDGPEALPPSDFHRHADAGLEKPLDRQFVPPPSTSGSIREATSRPMRSASGWFAKAGTSSDARAADPRIDPLKDLRN